MSSESSISRRKIIGGMVTAAAAPLLGGAALGAPFQRPDPPQTVSDGVDSNAKSRFNHAAVQLRDGRVVFTGGYDVNENVRSRRFAPPSASAQIFDPSTGVWADLAPMITGRARHASVQLSDGRVAVIGGVSRLALNSVEIYNASSNQWEAADSLPEPIYDFTASVAGKYVVLTGGPHGIPAQYIQLGNGVTTELP